MCQEEHICIHLIMQVNEFQYSNVITAERQVIVGKIRNAPCSDKIAVAGETQIFIFTTPNIPFEFNYPYHIAHGFKLPLYLKSLKQRKFQKK